MSQSLYFSTRIKNPLWVVGHIASSPCQTCNFLINDGISLDLLTKAELCGVGVPTPGPGQKNFELVSDIVAREGRTLISFWRLL